MESQPPAAAVDGHYHAVHHDHHDVKPSREAAVLGSKVLSRLDPPGGGHCGYRRTAAPIRSILPKAKHDVDLLLADAALLTTVDRMRRNQQIHRPSIRGIQPRVPVFVGDPDRRSVKRDY